MQTDVIVALVSFAGSVIVALISYSASRKGAKEAAQMNAQLLEYRLSQLETKMDKHNQVLERVALAEQDRKAIWHRIDELSRGGA